MLVHVDTDLEYQSPGGDGWWDVPVAEVSELDFTQDARETYDEVQGHPAAAALSDASAIRADQLVARINSPECDSSD